MRLYPLKLHLKHDIFHCILLFIVDRFFFLFFFPPLHHDYSSFFSLPYRPTNTDSFSNNRFSISFEFPTKFYPVTFITRTFLPTCYISVSSSHNNPLYLTLIYPRCSFASPPSFLTASPIRSTVFTLLFYFIPFLHFYFFLFISSIPLFISPSPYLLYSAYSVANARATKENERRKNARRDPDRNARYLFAP